MQYLHILVRTYLHIHAIHAHTCNTCTYMQYIHIVTYLLIHAIMYRREVHRQRILFIINYNVIAGSISHSLK